MEQRHRGLLATLAEEDAQVARRLRQWLDGEEEEEEGVALEVGNLEVYKALRDIAAAEDFTALDLFSLRGAVLALAPFDADPTIFPFCEVIKLAAPARFHCLFTALSMRIYTTAPPSVRSVATERQPVPMALGMPPPELQDVGVVPLFIQDKGLIAAEKPVYHWFWLQILNLYGFSYRWNDMIHNEGYGSAAEQALRPLLPEGEGYGNQNLLYVEGPRDIPFRRPLGQSFTYTGASGCKKLLVVLRGTIYSEEWTANFRLNKADPEEVAAFGFAGAYVPKGFFSLFTELVPQVDAALAQAGAAGVQELTIAGHSLGGGMTVLLSTYYGMKRPDLKISAITFGAPNAGDAAFAHFFSPRVNIRQIYYVGSGLLPGQDPTSFGLGDMVAQLPPDCTAASPCPVLLFRQADGLGDLFARVQMARLPGAVMFYARDMPNTNTWLKYEDYLTHIFTRMDRGIPSSHFCAYSCYLSTAVSGDDENRCYFPEEAAGRTPGDICDLQLFRSELMHRP